MILATTRASVYRAIAQNGLGDDVDDNTTPVAGLIDFPISIIERTRKVYDQASGTQRTIRTVVGRAKFGLAIQRNDRVKDLRSGRIYAVDEVTSAPRSLGGTADLTLDLRLV